jgi:5-methylcytosine-specific restriction endonuclease McrA
MTHQPQQERRLPVDTVLVINADLGPLHRVSLRHAIRMLCRRVAEVHEAEPDRLIGVFPLPKVVRLVQYVVTKWRYTAGPAWSRSGVLNRDGHRCGYCTGRATTVDHILPRSRGGRNTWANTVAACGGCNQRKGDRTPAEAGMRLRFKATTPTWATLAQR